MEEGESIELNFDFIEKEKDEKQIVDEDIEHIDSETLITIKGCMFIDKNEKVLQKDGNTMQMVQAAAITLGQTG